MDGSHDRFETRLSEYVDGSLTAGDARALERHLESCDACRTATAELRRVREVARALPTRGPARDLWPGIRARLDEPEVLTLPVGRPRRRVFRLTAPQLAAATAALTLATGALGWALGAGSAAADVAADGAAVGGPASFAATAPEGNPSLGEELAELEAVLGEARERLDPATVRVLEKNLAVIERAIRESREALAVDPGNAYLEEHLENALRRKRDYLTQAAELVRWVS